MRAGGSRIGNLAVPLRVLAQRFAFLLLIGGAVALLVLAKAGYPPLERARTAFLDVAAPVLGALSQPVTAANRLVAEVTYLTGLYDENARLRLENERLRNWQAVARSAGQENAAYRALLRVQPEPGMTFVTGRVVADSGGPFVRALLLNAGRRAGVVGGAAVVAAEGLVGRIVEAGERSARVLLLTDLNSRVPIVDESSRYRAILEGDNSDTLRLGFLTSSDDVRVGDRIVTSGHGGIFPAGLPVGDVTAIVGDEAIVTPFVDFDRLEYVRVLLFDFPGMDDLSDAEREP